MEPDEQAQVQSSKKRLIGVAQGIDSPRSQPDDYEQYSSVKKRDARKRK